MINFSNKEYMNKATEVMKKDYVNLDNMISNEDAFIVLLKDIEYHDLNNLCDLISIKLNISSKEAYNLIRNPISKRDKLVILYCAYETLKNGNYLGRNINTDININTSSWLSHSLYEAIVSCELASILGLNEEYAFNYGLLHDYGRKYAHDFRHIIKGFESLIDMGLIEESKACLTHSFINGKRFFNNEKATNEYKVENNKEIFKEQDEIAEVLNVSKYTMYDNILNIADLMATDKGIVSPYDRVLDIATRRKKIETSPNRKYFLASFYNLLLDVLIMLDKSDDYKSINPDEMNIEDIRNQFKNISDKFYSVYKESKKDKQLKKILKIDKE